MLFAVPDKTSLATNIQFAVSALGDFDSATFPLSVFRQMSILHMNKLCEGTLIFVEQLSQTFQMAITSGSPDYLTTEYRIGPMSSKRAASNSAAQWLNFVTTGKSRKNT